MKFKLLSIKVAKMGVFVHMELINYTLVSESHAFH